MSSPDEELRIAMAAHKAERLDEAEAAYLRVLEARPNHAKALYYLGLLQFHRGDTASAITFVQRCLTFARTNGPAWNTLGSLFIAADRRAEARDAYRRVTVVAPAMGEGWYNYGICLRDEGDVDGAITALRASLVNEPGYSRAYEALAMLFYQIGRTQESADVYREWAAREPQNAKARHMMAAALQHDVPARAADDYVRELFDDAAKSFDADIGKLNYRAPALVAEALVLETRAAEARALEARAAAQSARGSAQGPPGAGNGKQDAGNGKRDAAPAVAVGSVLDAGCGTGLCAPLLRPHCARLVGVDLSPQMLERARARECYDELVPAELSAFMRSRVGAFDAIVSADTLVYFGALEEPLSAARGALRDNGLLVFTLESLPPAPAPAPATATAAAPAKAQNYRLEAHGRYAHSEQYVRDALATAGFSVAGFVPATLREERHQPVSGVVVTARRV